MDPNRFADLTYDGFRELARDESLSLHEKVGFPDSYRAGREEAILRDVRAKLSNLERAGCKVLDVGPGCGAVALGFLDLLPREGARPDPDRFRGDAVAPALRALRRQAAGPLPGGVPGLPGREPGPARRHPRLQRRPVRVPRGQRLRLLRRLPGTAGRRRAVADRRHSQSIHAEALLQLRRRRALSPGVHRHGRDPRRGPQRPGARPDRRRGAPGAGPARPVGGLRRLPPAAGRGPADGEPARRPAGRRNPEVRSWTRQ